MQALALVAVVLLLASASLASESLNYDGVKRYVDSYNSKVMGAPEPLKFILGNELVNLDVARNNGSLFKVGFEIKQAVVNSTVMGGIQNPTIIITASEGAIDRIAVSHDPLSEYQNETAKGQVSIISTNPWTGIKLGAVLSSMPVLRFFFSIFFG